MPQIDKTSEFNAYAIARFHGVRGWYVVKMPGHEEIAGPFPTKDAALKAVREALASLGWHAFPATKGSA